MSAIKVYIGCCKTDFYLLRSCIASIRYWNKEVPVFLLKDFSRGAFNTQELERVFNVGVVPTKFKELGGYMKLQPYIEATEEKIFSQDADMVWLGDIISLLEGCDEDIAVHAYSPADLDSELNLWYFNKKNLDQYYPDYRYPGFLFNCGSIFLNKKVFTTNDFKSIITWHEKTKPIHDDVFLCEDQGIINYIVSKKYLANAITIAEVPFQIDAASAAAANYPLDKIKNKEQQKVIVHWLGKKTGLNAFYSAKHLLRFYEKNYYSQLKNGYVRLLADRLKRTTQHFGRFAYEVGKAIYYTFIPRKK